MGGEVKNHPKILDIIYGRSLTTMSIMCKFPFSLKQVSVYNLQKNPNKPSYFSTARNGKHQDIVWQVKWAKDNLDGYLNFYSVSGDGRVNKIILFCQIPMYRSRLINLTIFLLI